MPSKKIVDEFVIFNNLRKEDNSIVFNAHVYFYQGDVLHKLPSQIQIITLPLAMVLYIDEFFHDGYQQPEIYSSEDFYFSHIDGGLEIRGYESQPDFLIRIMLIG